MFYTFAKQVVFCLCLLISLSFSGLPVHKKLQINFGWNFRNR